MKRTVLNIAWIAWAKRSRARVASLSTLLAFVLSGCALEVDVAAEEEGLGAEASLRTSPEIYSLVPTPGSLWQLPICSRSTPTCIGIGSRVTFRLWGAGAGGGTGLWPESRGGGGGGGGGAGAFIERTYLLPTNVTLIMGSTGAPGSGGYQPSVLATAGGDTWATQCTASACAPLFLRANGGRPGWVWPQLSEGGEGGLALNGPFPFIGGTTKAGLPGANGQQGTQCSGQNGGAGAAGWFGYGSGGAGGHGGYHHIFPQCMSASTGFGLTPGSLGAPGRTEISWN